MTEDVLQYIWQRQSFAKNNLSTSDKEEIIVYQPGKLNTGSGPDFSEAKVKIGEMTWVGDIEIHTYASHWENHRHNHDEAYDKVVLHVVWEEDRVIFRMDGTRIPTLELKHSLDPDWYSRYQHLMHSLSAVPCQNYLPSMDKLVISDAIHSALVDRLERKAAVVIELLQQNNGDWEQTVLAWLFAGFGFQKNKNAFQELARQVDHRIIRKLSSETQVAAYLFGLSGLLPTRVGDPYLARLKREYAWLSKKFDLDNRGMTVSWWKFMRMRPANFPTLRLAQLATLLSAQKSILRTILEGDTNTLLNLFQVEHNEFWQSHYHFNSLSAQKLSGMGRQSQVNLLINVVAVLLVAYGKYQNKAEYIKKAVKLLESLAPEANKVIRMWHAFDILPHNAAESQGLLGLFNNYCKKSRCLSCSIGMFITKPQ